MSFRMLIFLALACQSAIWCGNKDCTNCTSGYNFESKMCITECPTGYNVSADNKKCNTNSSLVFINFEVDDSYLFNTSSIGGFSSRNESSLLSNPKEYPLITKDRGLLFTSKSFLEAKNGWVLSPTHRVSYLIRCFSPGIIFRVYLGNQTLVSVSWNKTHLTHSYLLTSIQKTIELGGSISYQSGWRAIAASTYYLGGAHYIDFTSKILTTFPNFEFRQQFSNSTFVLGSENNSFVGFLSRFEIRNSISGDFIYTSIENLCNYNQYLFNFQCYDCNTSCPTYPLCTRNSCNLCYSSNCSSCQGFRFLDCFESTSGTLPDSGFNCLNGSFFSCLECKTGFILSEGLCVNPVYNPDGIDIKSSLSPVINVKFNVFSQFYDIFQSGNNSSTWHPDGNPDLDDPVHYTMRGLYMGKDKLSYLKTTVSVTLNYNFTIAVWVFNQGGSYFLYKSAIQLVDYYSVRLKLRNIDNYVHFRSSQAPGNIYRWCLFGASVYFNGKTTTLVSSLNMVLYTSLTKSGFYFFDSPDSLFIGNYPQAFSSRFYYSVTVWQRFITDFSMIKDICGKQVYAGCLWNCSESTYYNILDKRCRNCSSECTNGCSIFGSCNKCFNVSCANCSTYTDNYTCDSNLNFNPCVQGSLYINSTKCCPSQCLNCFENSILKCLWCTSDYSLLGTACYSTCPIGFKRVNSVCVLIDFNMIFEVNFYNFDSVVWSTNQRVNFSVPYPSKFYKILNKNNPRPALNRGYYFSINSYMNSSLFAVAYNFTINFWIKVAQDGVLFSRNDLKVFTDQLVSVNGTDYSLKFDSSKSWKIFHLLIMTIFDGYQLIQIRIIETSMGLRNFWISDNYIFDGNQILQLGSNQVSFEGFLWKIRFYHTDMAESSSSLLLCSAGITSNCLVDCSIDSFFNGSSCRLCPNCSLGCVRATDCNLCSDPICENCSNFTSVCSECFNDSSLQTNHCACNSGFYWNQSKLMCSKCKDLCVNCSGEFNCSKCQQNSVNIGGVCFCETGFYFNGSGNCDACHSECLNCSGQLNSECISCATNSYLDPKNSCICNEGFYKNGSNCETCDILCETCFSSTSTSCLSCKNNMLLNSNNSCVCPSSQYFENNTCSDCDIKCLECFGSDEEKCSKCRENANLVNNSCVCQEGWLMIDGICKPCHKTCLRCSGQTKSECLECRSEFRLQSSGQCFCEMGKFWDESRETCENCSKFCLECNSFYSSDCQVCSEECFFCNDFSIFINGSCRCLTGYYINNDQCLQCHESCLECFDNQFYTCTNCSNFLLNGVCYENCPIGSISISGECFFSDQLVLLRFQDFTLKVSDSLKRIETETCEIKLSNKTLNPAASFIYRGAYFNGENSCLQISGKSKQILFSNTFEFSVWILLYNSGPVLHLRSKDLSFWPVDLRFLEEKLDFSLVINSIEYFYAVNHSTLYSNWKFLQVKTEFFNVSTITITIDSKIIRFSNPSLVPFTSDDSYVFLGSDLRSSLLGFIYQISLNNFKYSTQSFDCNWCSSCPTDQGCLPPCKTTEYFNFTTKECLSCGEGCSYGCINDSNCGMCFDFACVSCDGFNEFSCLSCKDGFILINRSCHECPIGTYFNFKTKQCDDCFFLCKNCSKLQNCSSCVENAHISDSHCICNKGFKLKDKKCEISYFFVILTINFDNEITLIFNEDPEKPLSKNDLEVLINQNQVSYKIKKLKNSIFTLKLNNPDLKQNSFVNIQFFPIYSDTFSILFNKSAKLSLFHKEKSEISDKIEESTTYGKMGSSIGLSISLFSGIMSMDLTSVFNFMNFAEIFSAASLYGTQAPEDMLEFLRSLRIKRMIPNFFEKTVGKGPTATLNPLFKSFGFPSNRMIVNSGTNLIILALILVTFIIQKFFLNVALNKIPKLVVIREYFHYKIFIEYWLQTSFEFLATSSYSILISSWDNPWDIIDYSLSCLMLVSYNQIFQFLAFTFSCYIFFKRSKSSSERQKIIDSKFGYLFTKLKQDSNNSLSFHFIFFLRRVLMTILILSPMYSELRLILSSVVSISIAFYLSTSFPFKSKVMNFLHLSNEFITFSVHILMLFYLLGVIGSSVNKYCMNFVTASWVLNWICCFFDLIATICSKIISKMRKKDRVEPITSQDYDNRSKPMDY